MWPILGTKPPGNSGVEVHIFLKCLNGLTTCWGQAGYRNITCCAACSDLTGSRKRWMYSWLLHIPRKYSKSVTSILNYGYMGCCATSSDLRRQSWSTNGWVWSYVLSVLYPKIVRSITALILFCDRFCRWQLPFLPQDLVLILTVARDVKLYDLAWLTPHFDKQSRSPHFSAATNAWELFGLYVLQVHVTLTWLH